MAAASSRHALEELIESQAATPVAGADVNSTTTEAVVETVSITVTE